MCWVSCLNRKTSLINLLMYPYKACPFQPQAPSSFYSEWRQNYIFPNVLWKIKRYSTINFLINIQLWCYSCQCIKFLYCFLTYIITKKWNKNERAFNSKNTKGSVRVKLRGKRNPRKRFQLKWLLNYSKNIHETTRKIQILSKSNYQQRILEKRLVSSFKNVVPGHQ